VLLITANQNNNMSQIMVSAEIMILQNYPERE